MMNEGDHFPVKLRRLTLRKKVRLQIRQREQHWDNRIYKNVLTDLSQIPLPETFTRSQDHQEYQDRYPQPRKNLHDSTQDRIMIDTKGSTLNNLQFSNAFVVQKYIRMQLQQQKKQEKEITNNVQLEDKLEQMNSLWLSCKIPPSHSNQLLSIIDLLSCDEQMIQVGEEIILLQRKLSPVQRCVYSIAAREKCLKVFTNHISQIQSIMQFDTLPKQSQSDFVRRSSELLLHIRLLSLNVVEGIQRWRQYLNQKRQLIHNNQDCSFIHYLTQDGTNYIMKLVDDYQLIRQSILINFLDFSAHSDPFLICLLKDHHQQIHGPDNKKSLSEMLNRVRKCEVEVLTCMFRTKAHLQEQYETKNLDNDIQQETVQQQEQIPKVQPPKEEPPKQQTQEQPHRKQHSILENQPQPKQASHKLITEPETKLSSQRLQEIPALNNIQKIDFQPILWEDIIMKAQSQSLTYQELLRINFIPERKRQGSARHISIQSNPDASRVFSDAELEVLIELKKKTYQICQTAIGIIIYCKSGSQMFVLYMGSELPNQEQYLIDSIMDIIKRDDEILDIEFNVHKMEQFMDQHKHLYDINEHKLVKKLEAIKALRMHNDSEPKKRRSSKGSKRGSRKDSKGSLNAEEKVKSDQPKI